MFTLPMLTVAAITCLCLLVALVVGDQQYIECKDYVFSDFANGTETATSCSVVCNSQFVEICRTKCPEYLNCISHLTYESTSTTMTSSAAEEVSDKRYLYWFIAAATLVVCLIIFIPAATFIIRHYYRRRLKKWREREMKGQDGDIDETVSFGEYNNYKPARHCAHELVHLESYYSLPCVRQEWSEYIRTDEVNPSVYQVSDEVHCEPCAVAHDNLEPIYNTIGDDDVSDDTRHAASGGSSSRIVTPWWSTPLRIHSDERADSPTICAEVHQKKSYATSDNGTLPSGSFHLEKERCSEAAAEPELGVWCNYQSTRTNDVYDEGMELGVWELEYGIGTPSLAIARSTSNPSGPHPGEKVASTVDDAKNSGDNVGVLECFSKYQASRRNHSNGTYLRPQTSATLHDASSPYVNQSPCVTRSNENYRLLFDLMPNETNMSMSATRPVMTHQVSRTLPAVRWVNPLKFGESVTNGSAIDLPITRQVLTATSTVYGLSSDRQSNCTYYSTSPYQNVDFSEENGPTKPIRVTSRVNRQGDVSPRRPATGAPNGRYHTVLLLNSSETTVESNGLTIHRSASLETDPVLTIGVSALDCDLPRLEREDVPLSDVLNCHPHGETFQEPVIMKVPLYREAEGPLTVWYTATDTGQDTRWQKVGELTTVQPRIVLNDGLDGSHNEAVLLPDMAHVEFHLHHFCSFVITEKNIGKWCKAILRVLLEFIADPSRSTSIINVACIVALDTDAMIKENNRLEDRGYKVEGQLEFLCYNETKHLTVAMSDAHYSEEFEVNGSEWNFHLDLVRNGIVDRRNFRVKTKVHPCSSHFEATIHVVQDGNITATLPISTDLTKMLCANNLPPPDCPRCFNQHIDQRHLQPNQQQPYLTEMPEIHKRTHCARQYTRNNSYNFSLRSEQGDCCSYQTETTMYNRAQRKIESGEMCLVSDGPSERENKTNCTSLEQLEERRHDRDNEIDGNGNNAGNDAVDERQGACKMIPTVVVASSDDPDYGQVKHVSNDFALESNVFGEMPCKASAS